MMRKTYTFLCFLRLNTNTFTALSDRRHTMQRAQKRAWAAATISPESKLGPTNELGTLGRATMVFKSLATFQ